VFGQMSFKLFNLGGQGWNWFENKRGIRVEDFLGPTQDPLKPFNQADPDIT
jgi:hypothetical protein